MRWTETCTQKCDGAARQHAILVSDEPAGQTLATIILLDTRGQRNTGQTHHPDTTYICTHVTHTCTNAHAHARTHAQDAPSTIHSADAPTQARTYAHHHTTHSHTHNTAQHTAVQAASHHKGGRSADPTRGPRHHTASVHRWHQRRGHRKVSVFGVMQCQRPPSPQTITGVTQNAWA